MILPTTALSHWAEFCPGAQDDGTFETMSSVDTMATAVKDDFFLKQGWTGHSFPFLSVPL